MSKGNIDAFLKALFQREAGGNIKVINYAGYIGKYQFGESALVDLGYYTADGTAENDWAGNWTGKHGIKQRSDFLDSETAQDIAAKEWVALLCKRMKKAKLNDYIGQTIKGIVITESGIIAGAHLKGFGNSRHPGVTQFLHSNGAIDAQDGLKTTVSHYVGLLGDYELGCCNKLTVVFAEKNTGAPIPGLNVEVRKNGRPHKTAKTDAHGFLPPVHGLSAGDQYEVYVAKLTGGYKLLKAGVMKDVDATLAFLSPKSRTTTTTEQHKGQAADKTSAAPATASKPTHAVPQPEAKQPDPPAEAKKTPGPDEAGTPAAPAEFTSVKPIDPDQLDRDSRMWDSLQSVAPVPTAVSNTDAAAAPVETSPSPQPNKVIDAAPVAENPSDAPAPPAVQTALAIGDTASTPADTAPSSKSEKSAAPAVSAEAEKTRSAKGHPKAIAKKAATTPAAPPTMPMQKTISGLLFPLEKRPKESYRDGARFFGAARAGGRSHAGIDLYAPVGSPVRAMADGTVKQVYEFYLGTWVIEVDHGTFLARYGEVSHKNILVRKKDEVKRGQQLGAVGQLQGLKFSMLHLEMYATTESPVANQLTQKKLTPFQRRADLINPSDSIDQATLE